MSPFHSSPRLAHLFAAYQDRPGKAQFINEHFHDYLTQATSILDIGCDDNRFKAVWGTKVTGVDVGGKPDFVVNLEKEKLSRFSDNAFDVLICTDVLEHIDNFHAVLDDMVRVCRGRIIISLPNCAHIFRILPVLSGRSSGKYYGLPLQPPADRHKWFFNWHELSRFFHHYTKGAKTHIESEFLAYGYRSPLRRALLHLLSTVIPVTAFAQGYWVVLKKNPADDGGK